jgi:hypothetical protein
MEIVIDTLDRTPQVSDAVGAQSTINFRVMRLIRASIVEATDDMNIFVYGIAVGIDQVANPDFILPAVLWGASETARLSAASNPGKGGFAFHMRADVNAVLGYKVSHIEVSSPRVLVLSIVDVIRRYKRGGEFILDDLVARFGDFLRDDLNQDPQPGEGLEISLLMAGA